MIWFVSKPHTTRHGLTVIEVWRREEELQAEFVASIYPQADGLRLVSAYEGLVGAHMEDTLFEGQEKRLRVVSFEIGKERMT